MIYKLWSYNHIQHVNFINTNYKVLYSPSLQIDLEETQQKAQCTTMVPIAITVAIATAV